MHEIDFYQSISVLNKLKKLDRQTISTFQTFNNSIPIRQKQYVYLCNIKAENHLMSDQINHSKLLTDLSKFISTQ